MDLAEIRARKAQAQADLNSYLVDAKKYQKEITVTRGRLLRLLYKEYKLETDVGLKNTIKNEIRTQLGLHKVQLSNRIKNQNVKESMFKQIPRELGLKFKKVVANIKNIKYGSTGQEKVGSGLKVLGNALSMGGTVLKVPVVGALKLGGAISSTVGKIMLCPLHIPTFFFSKIINPDKKYTGQAINNMGNGLGKQISNILKLTEQGIRKL